MAANRTIRYHKPPSWTRPVGLGDDYSDYGVDLWGDSPATPSVEGITVDYTPPTVDVSPPDSLTAFDPYIAPSTPLFDPTGWDTTPQVPNIPQATAGPAAAISSFLQKLTSRKPASGGGGGGGSAAISPPKLQPAKPVTPAHATNLAANPALAAGAALAALVFAAALLSGHHDRRGRR